MDVNTVMAWPAYRNVGENPYNSQLYTAIAAEGVDVLEFNPRDALTRSYDILHIHWPDALLKNIPNVKRAFRLFALAALLAYVRFVRRRVIVWTVHNLRPHGGDVPSFYIRTLHAVLAKTVSYQIHLNGGTGQSIADLGNERLTKMPSTVIRHGRYQDVYSTDLTQSQSRSKIGVSGDGFLVGFVGNLSEYKGIKDFLRAFPAVSHGGKPEITGLVAGRATSPELESDLRDLAEGKNVEIRFGWLDTEEISNYVRACDLVVYPYKSIENSGSVFLSLEIGTPVLVPEVSSMLELRADVGKEWVHLIPDTLTLVDVRNALKDVGAGRPDLGLFSWNFIAQETLSTYRSALDIGSILDRTLR